MFIRLTLLLQFMFSIPAWASASPKDLNEFRATSRAYMADRPFRGLPSPRVGSTIYVPVQNIVAGQTRFSFRRMVAQIEDVLDNNGNDTLTYDKGRSAYPKSEARGGIFYRGRVHIFDRHHHTMANIFLGGETMPVYIAGDWSSLSPQKFYAQLLSKGLIYPWGSDGTVMKIPDVWELEEDPYLSIPDLFILKVKTKKKNGHYEVKSAKGADPVLMLKIDDGQAFFEFYAADPLHKHDFALPNLDQDLSLQQLDEISTILNEEAPHSRLKEAVILPKATPKADLDLQKIVDDYYSKPFACRKILRRRI